TSAAGTHKPKDLAGRDLQPLLENPIATWDGFAVTQILRPADKRLPKPVMGCSIRTERWRYTEWADGKQGVELYDHRTDPLEFHNLAINPDTAAISVIQRLQPLLRSRASGAVPITPFNPKRL
ncbi:MAG: sulfatase/phosphatase domain-containing protein, partial [Pirellulales bacterium]